MGLEPAAPGGLSRLIQFLIGLVHAKSYGRVLIQFKAGRIEYVKLEQSFHLDGLPTKFPTQDQPDGQG